MRYARKAATAKDPRGSLAQKMLFLNQPARLARIQVYAMLAELRLPLFPERKARSA